MAKAMTAEAKQEQDWEAERDGETLVTAEMLRKGKGKYGHGRYARAIAYIKQENQARRTVVKTGS